MERSPALALSVSLIGLFSLAHLAASHYSESFPPLSISLSSPASRLSDFAGISMGFRKLSADIAWAQTLIYYGTHEDIPGASEAEIEEMEHSGGGRYPHFLSYCQRVARIDPHFKHIYYYGGSVLGWNLNRLGEAEELLEEGIRAHPKEWRLQQFLAGLAFQKDHNISHLVYFLKGFAEEKECPNILRSILANIYKKQHLYLEAIHIWMIVSETDDPSYNDRSIEQIRELAPLAHQQARKMGHKAH